MTCNRCQRISIHIQFSSGNTILNLRGFLIFYIILLFYAYNNVHFGRVLPIGHSSISKIVSGSYWSFIDMLRFEIFLFISPSFQSSNKKLLTLTKANIFNTLLCTFTIYRSYIRLSNKENSYIIDPILYIFKTYNSKMVESLDTIYLSLCTIQICATVVTYLYIISESVHKRFYVIVKNRNSILLVIILLIFAFYPLISLRVIKRETIVHFGNYMDPVFKIMIPFLLLLIHKVRALIK
ncbi:GerAB/ArcD/ProY family transporter [Gottfriedia sp. NPDC056225]|uniref:GerAB/ArcD/ProY family transporter n=1 Tax=Gottfriedia sp. NPDC056225 TaxID=3345751 RepID=UPI0035DE2AAC